MKQKKPPLLAVFLFYPIGAGDRGAVLAGGGGGIPPICHNCPVTQPLVIPAHNSRHPAEARDPVDALHQLVSFGIITQVCCRKLDTGLRRYDDSKK